MDDKHDKVSDLTEEEEDIPSDFFDEFNKEEFMEGLNVIDSWNDAELDAISKRRSEHDAPNVDSDQKSKKSRNERPQGNEGSEKDDTRVLSRENSSTHRSSNKIDLDEYIKPGSRRDPSKTNEAIRRDKEVKVKEYLAKHLDPKSETRPPGTELDDFFNPDKTETASKSTMPVDEQQEYKNRRRSRSKGRQYRYSPKPSRSSPKHRYSKRDRNYSPDRSLKRTKIVKRGPRLSPVRRSRYYSPPRSHHGTFRRYSSRRPRLSRSPDRYHNFKSSKSRSRSRSRSQGHGDTFLYPDAPQMPTYSPNIPYQMGPAASYSGAPTNDFLMPDPSYVRDQAYTGGFSGYGGYATQPIQHTPTVMQVAQPGPVFNPVSAPVMNLGPPPSMVPPPLMDVLVNMPMQQHQTPTKTPYDALAQLVADGKLSQADYLKLTPNKGGTVSMDDKTRVMVLSRCDDAIAKLSKLLLPNRLMINNTTLGPEPKSIMFKYCSPLKRQPEVEFHFTKSDGSLTLRQNKQLLDSIIASVGLEKTFSKLKKRSKSMKDVAVQTTKSYCDVCEIRASMKINNVGTSIDADHFCATVHTQVVEEDLINSKSIFNPSGSVGISGPISIAHLTPAQLVSQLAARAKTLKQSEAPQSSNQFNRRNPPHDYDGRGGGQQYQYSNYHY